MALSFTHWAFNRTALETSVEVYALLPPELKKHHSISGICLASGMSRTFALRLFVTLWQSCRPAAAPRCACQCSAGQTADLYWHRGLPGWVTGSDIRSASGISAPAPPWQPPASRTATASPWLPPYLDTTPVARSRREMEMSVRLANKHRIFICLFY